MRVLDGRYRLDRRIGIGGMSEVWRAHDRVLDRPVAVKVITLHPDDRGDDSATIVDLVRAEARSAARLAHPNVAGVHDFGTVYPAPEQPSPYIVMELAEGETLAAHLRAGPLDWRIAVRICAEVSAALAAAHLHGIVHRDVKPANIMLTPSGVKVLDFGIAADIGRRDDRPTGEVVGTPAFTAPERFAGAPATPATDVYAVGVLLHLCLSGRLPWPVDTLRASPPSYVHLDPEPLPPVDGLPADVADLCRRCMAREPDGRPSSFAVALLLAQTVDAQVYVPVAGIGVPSPRAAAPAPWADRVSSMATGALQAATDVVRPTGGRHRA